MYINEGKVYVFQNHPGAVKIGCSKNVERRKRTLETQSGKPATRFYCTGICSNQYKVERAAHHALKDCRGTGEWFVCDFETAVEVVNEMFANVAEFNFVSEEASKEEMDILAKDFAKKFFSELFGEEEKPEDRLDANRWEPSTEDEEPILAFLRDWYEGSLEMAGEEDAQEDLELYEKVKETGVIACKDDIQGLMCDIFWAVGGEIEEYYKGNPNLLSMMNRTILKTPVSL